MENTDNNTESSLDTRHRLLDAAEKLFCQRGFEGASVRDITAEAGCNVAAVNYYFGSKEKLYEEMFHRRFSEKIQGHLATIERVCSRNDATIEDLLTELVRPTVESALRGDTWSRVVRFLVREAIQGRFRKDKVGERLLDQFFNRLAEAFQQLLPGLEPRMAWRCVLTFESLVLHPILFFELYDLVLPGFNVEEITEQIVRVASAGLRSCLKGTAE
jgi:AcrR family transcriptional regulator